MSEYTFKVGKQEITVDVRCLWCGESLEDGREETGYTGEGPDWGSTFDTDEATGTRKHPYGTYLDYGCSDSPDTNDDGTGSHTPNVLVTWDAHLVVLPIEDMHYKSVRVGEAYALTDDDWRTTLAAPAGLLPRTNDAAVPA